MNTPTDPLEADIDKILIHSAKFAGYWDEEMTKQFARRETINVYIPALKQAILALIHTREQQARASELGMMRPPKAEMIPGWNWPCYICGFDSEKLTKYIDDRLATLNKGEK